MPEWNWNFYALFLAMSSHHKVLGWGGTEDGGHFLNKLYQGPWCFLLGLPAKDIALTANRFLLCDKLLLLARKCILIEWIHSRPPSLSLWYGEIFRILPMERLTAVVRGDSAMFEEMWGPVMEHLPTSLQEIIFKGKFVFEWAFFFTE